MTRNNKNKLFVTTDNKSIVKTKITLQIQDVNTEQQKRTKYELIFRFGRNPELVRYPVKYAKPEGTDKI